jgi:hypothetical protein
MSRFRSDEERDSYIEGLETRLATLEKLLSDGRVRIRNFEGSLKTLAVAPTAIPGWEAGAVVLSDIAGTRKLNAYINGAWYAVTLT